MKRSDFFKSLAGIAVAPIVGVKVLSELNDADFYWEDNKLIFTPKGKKNALRAVQEVTDEAFEMKPNSDPPMTWKEYNKHIDELQEKLRKKIDREMGRHLI